MILAELHGKFTPSEERMEDILTSNVFSFFKYSKRDIFLKRLMQELGLEANAAELYEAEFIFWPGFQDGTEPDLVLVVGKYYLLFEAKYFSGFGQSADPFSGQISREIREGKLEAHNMEKRSNLSPSPRITTTKSSIWKIRNFVKETLSGSTGTALRC